MSAAHARKQQKLTSAANSRTDGPQLGGKPHASLGRSQDSDNNKPNSPAHTDGQAYIAKAQWHDAQATARNSTVYIMLIKHSCSRLKITASRETAAINMILKACQPCTQVIIHIAFKQKQLTYSKSFTQTAGSRLTSCSKYI